MLNVIECDLISSMVYERNFVNVNEKEIARNNSFKNIGNIKPIKYFPHYYISDEGKVYSTKWGKTKELKAYDNGEGYLQVGLRKDGKRYDKKVHRLVLETFQPIPEMDKYQVNHRDENPTNNKLENLEWCTAKYNNNYGNHCKKISEAKKGKKLSSSHIEAISKSHKGRKCPWTSDFNKLTKSKKVLQYDQNYNLINSFSSATEAGKAFNVSQGTISKYCNNLKLYKGKYYLQYESK